MARWRSRPGRRCPTSTGLDHTHLAANKEEEKIRFRDVVAQPRKIISSPTWSGLEDEHVCYNAGYTNVHELIPWRTLTGRQQFYQDHEWMRAFGESLLVYRPPIDTKASAPHAGARQRQREGDELDHTAPEMGYPQHLQRKPADADAVPGRPDRVDERGRRARTGIEDNDWIELFNLNGALTARAVVSQRVMPSMVMMYHAQERIVNIPGSEITGTRGGIHNSVTRVVPKPTHMIGGYAQFSYGLQLLRHGRLQPGRVCRGAQDENVDWLDAKVQEEVQEAAK